MDLSPAVVTRAELYEQVWAKPMLKLATEYRITATGLAKVCRKANIPVPPRGYWNKLKAGKPVMRRPPLPPGGDGRGERISIQPSSPSPGIDPVVDARTAAEQQPENRIQVSDQFRKPLGFPRNCGHLNRFRVRCPDAPKSSAVCAGVPAPDD